jgi:hypothetical protein
VTGVDDAVEGDVVSVLPVVLGAGGGMTGDEEEGATVVTGVDG